MAVSPSATVPGVALTSSWAVYYTVPSTVVATTAKMLLVCNTDTAAHTFSYAVMPSTAAPNVAGTRFSATTLKAHETKVIGLTDVMLPGYTIQAKADTGTVVSMTISGGDNT